MNTLTNYTLRIIAGANVATIIAMLAVGYSDHINPASHPLLANVGLAFPVFLLLNIAFLVFWLCVRKRWAVIPFGGLVVGFMPIRVYSPLNLRADAPEGSIKLMQYNVYGFNEWKDTNEPSEIIEYVKRQKPDILCMEEMPGGEKKELINKALAPTLAYNDTIDNGSITIYSKFPIVRHERIPYHSDSNNMSGVFFVLTAPKDTTIVIANHLEITGLSLEQRAQFKAMLKGKMQKDSVEIETKAIWRRLAESAKVRAPQADAIAQYIQRHKGKSIILMGDFNDSPISYVRRRIAEELTDCYVATANGPGISYHYSGFYVRIDNIFCSDHWMPYGCHVDNSIKASDHYPVVCLLKRRGN